MHTLLEQNTDQFGTNSFEKSFYALLSALGYEKRDNYYYSPIDTNFGISIYGSGNLHCTFNGGQSYFNVYIASSYPSNKIYYHVSSGEKVIYMRFYGGSGSAYTNLIIAHDESKKTEIFYGASSSGTSTQDIYIANINVSDILYDAPSALSVKVTADLPNAITRVPLFSNVGLLSELSSVIKIQSFPSISGTYLNVDGVIYRVVTMTTYVSGSKVEIPYFAFPVSDQ